MGPVYKFLLLALFFVLVCFAGSVLYRRINRKIMESKRGWEIAVFTILLFSVLLLLFFGSLYLLIEVYRFLAENK